MSEDPLLLAVREWAAALEEMFGRFAPQLPDGTYVITDLDAQP